MPRRARSGGRSAVMSLPSQTIVAAAHRMLAGERIEQACLADAVPAEHAGHLAGLGLERHGAQRLRGAVMEIDVVDVEHVCFANGE